MVKNKKPFIRSVYNLGEYNDNERDFGPSLTDPSQDETIDELVSRMLRGEVVNRNSARYDVSPEQNEDEVFNNQSVTERDGFDIAHIGPIMSAGEAASKVLKAGGMKVPPIKEKPQEGTVPAVSEKPKVDEKAKMP